MLRVTPDLLREKTVANGFADLHNHQFANLGFGGLAFWGAPSGPVDTALPWCTPAHGPGGLGDVIGNVVKTVYGSTPLGHHVGGYPEFDGWPRWDSVTHQAVHVDWLHRAWQGGLRLMVMLAVNNEHLAGMANRAPGRSPDDMEAADLQLQAAVALQAAVDEESGGPGQGWYRIVRSPAEARQVIDQGKLAVVLGIEVDYLFGSKPGGPASADSIRNAVRRYHDMGVRHLFPLHFADNSFGGAGFQNALNLATDDSALNPLVNLGSLGFYGMRTEDGTPSGYEYRTGRRNSAGLSDLGLTLVRSLMAYGIMIDVDHMSQHTRSQTLDLAERYQYPVVSSHSGFIDICHGAKRHEGQLTGPEVERIYAGGGMVAPIIRQGDLSEIDAWPGPGTVIEHVQGPTSNSWVQAYRYAADKAAGGPVGLGTDFNGFAGLPLPRFGPDAADVTGGGPAPGGVTYPFTAAATGLPMDQSVIGQRTFDVNDDSLAHVGMLPDWIADVQSQGLTEAELAPLLASADGYVSAWARAWSARYALVFYDRATGQGEFYRTDPAGQLAALSSQPGWRQSWSAIVTGQFGGDAGGDLFFYDRNAGQAEIYTCDPSGYLTRLSAHSGLRTTWSHVVAGDFGGDTGSDLFFYDQASGHAEFYSVSGAGQLALLRSHDGLPTDWSVIIPGAFGGDGSTDLLCYRAAAGAGDFFAVTPGGDLAPLRSHNGWRTTWRAIVPGNFTAVTGTDLLFYDPLARQTELYTVNKGAISLVRRDDGWRGDWTMIVPGSFGGAEITDLLCYAAATGEAEIFVTAPGAFRSLRRFTGFRTTWSVIRQITRVADPPPWRQLATVTATISPRPVPLDRPVQITVSAVDSVAGTAVPGTVFADGVAIGPANTAITATLRQRVTREFDPDLKRWLVTREPPTVTVQATGYPPADVEIR
jgi:microsomal dipeptidase-like Zn-dependent dipeptidase